jgi:uncharacterized membrane protein
VPTESLADSRLAAFSDGVFAVAITLLVLDLQVPKGTLEPLPQFLAGELSSYGLFVVSFAIVGIKWLNHHRMFERIRSADTTLTMLNLALLLGISIVPFTTALLGRYLGTPDAALASVVYGVVWTLNGVAYTLVLGYARRAGLTPTSSTPAERRVLLLYAIGPLGYAAGAALSLVSVPLAIAIYCVVVAIYVPPYGTRPKPLA